MGLLEDALRQTFAARVLVPPAVEDQADRAIRAAYRTRRRRRGVALVMTAVVSVLALTTAVGVVAASKAPHTELGVELATEPSRSLSAYVLAGTEIDGPAQARRSLTDLAQRPLRAWRYSSGFLVETAIGPPANKVQLWWVPGAGEPVALLQADHVEVAPARQTRGLQSGSEAPMVAWDVAGKIAVARFGGGRLGAPQSTGGAAGLRVVGLTTDGVLLASERGTFDMWFPGKGAFEPGPASDYRMLAVSSNGTELYGILGAGCFGTVGPHGMGVLKQSCSLGIGSSDGVWPSPDGRRIAVTSTRQVRIFELSSIFVGAGSAASWSLAASAATWLAGDAFVVLTPEGTVRLDTDGRSPGAPARVPAAAAAGAALVPELGG